MSSLNNIERIKLEKLFDMASGYVLNFSNRTFSDFVFESVAVDIYNAKYADLGESKANRLRSFWKKEDDQIVAQLLCSLLEYFKEIFIVDFGWNDDIQELYSFAISVTKRLQGELGEHIAAIQAQPNNKDHEIVAKSVRQLIQENKPEEAMDRLHTYFTMFIHELCTKHSILFDSNKPVHSLMGEYVKCLSSKSLLESVMAERILRYAINIVDAFNDVRNNKSLAHANKLLNYEESLLIFRTVSSVVSFIKSVELKIDAQKQQTKSLSADLPF